MNIFGCIVNRHTPYMLQFILSIFIQNIYYLRYFISASAKDMLRLDIEHIFICRLIESAKIHIG